jgi:hypothetical protein
MTALLFDTLRLSRTLRDKGHFTSEQAEALAEALGEATQGDLATKGDLASVWNEIAKVRTEIAELRSELKIEIAQVRSELRTEIAALRTEMAEMKADFLKWIIGAVGFQTVVSLGAPVLLMIIFAT